jgi:hypothetical protein
MALERAGYKPGARPRALTFFAFRESKPGSDTWLPLENGDFETVRETARTYAGIHDCRVLIIALLVGATAPRGLTEKALLRVAQAW